jgi:hypothetical protein
MIPVIQIMNDENIQAMPLIDLTISGIAGKNGQIQAVLLAILQHFPQAL